MSSRFLVTDTHPLLWYIGKHDARLPRKVLAAFKSAEQGTGTYIWVPVAVVWEISQLMKRTKRFTVLGSLQELAHDNFYSKSIAVADLVLEDVLNAHNLNFTRDPFDALIVGTAQRLGAALITADVAITDASPCPIFWD